METARQRLIYFIENQKIRPIDFLQKTGLKKGLIDRSHQKSGVSDIVLSQILESYSNINANWLLTGKGEMLVQENEIQENEIQSFNLKTDHPHKNQEIPLYSLEASAGLVELFRNQNDHIPIDTIKIPSLPKCDGALYVTGDSMYPLLKSGDIIIYKQIEDFVNDVFWGEMYIISIQVGDEEYISVKYVQKSEEGPEWIKLVSKNAHHQSKSVHWGKVRAMALVKASIRINAM